jgi:short-subunit dehydrogenase
MKGEGNLMDIRRRVVLITGASSGLGLAMARRFAGAGYRVYGTARKPVTSTNPYGDFRLIQMDVNDDAQVRVGVQEILSREGRLDILVNNAGFGVAGALEDTSEEEALAQFQTNFFGMHRVCRAVLPQLRAQDYGYIVNVGSLAGLMAIPFEGMYSAAKFAVEGYSEGLRMEVRRFGIRVVVVEPGDCATGFNQARRFAAASGAASAYRDTFLTALSVVDKDENGGTKPERVADAVLRIVERRSPRLRYSIGPAYQRVTAQFKRILPASVFAWMISSHYRKGAPAPERVPAGTVMPGSRAR